MIVLLNDIIYVSQMRMNLSFIFALTKKVFEAHFIFKKITIEKYGRVTFNDKYIKKYGIMFKFDKMNKTFDSTYIDCLLNMNINMQHQCLCYITLKKVKHITIKNYTKCR